MLFVLKNRLLKTDDKQITRSKAMSAPTLIVLPFKTLSDNPKHRYFSEGLTEDVIAQLSKFSTRAVVARHSDLGAKEPGGPLSQAEAFGADYLLTGSVRWLGDRLRLAVELVAVPGGSVLWAERLDRQSPDLSELQDDLSRYLTGAIPYRIE